MNIGQNTNIFKHNATTCVSENINDRPSAYKQPQQMRKIHGIIDKDKQGTIYLNPRSIILSSTPKHLTAIFENGMNTDGGIKANIKEKRIKSGIT